MQNLKRLSWLDVTLDQYIEIQDLHLDGITGIDFVLEVGDLFFDLPEDLTESELTELRGCIKFVYAEPYGKTRQYLRGYHLKIFTKLSYSQWVDLDVTLTENSFPEALPLAAAILYGQIEDELKVGEVVGAVRDFVKYRQETIEQYEGVFGEDEEDELEDEEVEPEKEEPKEKAGAMWMRTIYQLADGDVTKYPHIISLPHRLVLNWVAMGESLKSRQQSRIV